MKVNVYFFAASREIVGKTQMEFELQEGESVSELLQIIRSHFHDLLTIEITVAVNAEYTNNAYILHNGDEVAIIPPVSGG